MKKVYSILTLVLVLSLTFISCSRSKLAIAVKAMDSQCPQSVDGGELTSVKLDGNSVVFNMTLEDDDDFTLSMLNNDFMKSIMKVAMIKSLQESQEGKEMIDLLIEAEANVVYEITGEKSGEVCRIVINTEELKAENTENVKDFFEGINDEDFEEELDQLSKDYEEEFDKIEEEINQISKDYEEEMENFSKKLEEYN